jgi:signal transduction histidine kinase
MLLTDATTRSEVVTVPSELEALVAAPGRADGRPLVALLKQEKLNVTLVGDADSAFEEALLHRPNIIVIHDDLPPAGGSELIARLKANTRTHFLPAVLVTTAENRQQRIRALAAGADAVFSPDADEQERRTRIWSLLRSQALYRRQENRREAQRTVISERTRWLGNFVHDLQNAIGALQANFEFLGQHARSGQATDRSDDLLDCQRETRSLLQQMARGLRTVQDYERFESGGVVLHATPLDLAELLHEVKEELVWQLNGETRPVQIEAGPAPLEGDRDLLRQALALMAAYLLRQPRASVLKLQIQPDDVTPGQLRLILASDGEPIPEEDWPRVFEPYARVPRRGGLAYGVGLALARSIIDLHGGRVRVVGGPGPTFAVELKSQDSLPNSPLGL